MGKYMKKAKSSGEAAAMESTTVGVRTRARTLALQSNDSAAYIELRSRRLEKSNVSTSPKPKNPNPKNDRNRGVGGGHKKEEEVVEEEVGDSFGENVLDNERTFRETTPCSMIMDPETMGTPCSITTRPTSFTSASSRRMQSSIYRNIPTSHEIEEFFADAERLQQRTFTEKYNFDPVNDCPLPGRYEWLLLD